MSPPDFTGITIDTNSCVTEGNRPRLRKNSMMEEVSIEEDVSIVEGFSLRRGLSNSARPHHSSVDVVSVGHCLS